MFIISSIKNSILSRILAEKATHQPEYYSAGASLTAAEYTSNSGSWMTPASSIPPPAGSGGKKPLVLSEFGGYSFKPDGHVANEKVLKADPQRICAIAQQ